MYSGRDGLQQMKVVVDTSTGEVMQGRGQS